MKASLEKDPRCCCMSGVDVPQIHADKQELMGLPALPPSRTPNPRLTICSHVRVILQIVRSISIEEHINKHILRLSSSLSHASGIYYLTNQRLEKDRKDGIGSLVHTSANNFSVERPPLPSACKGNTTTGGNDRTFERQVLQWKDRPSGSTMAKTPPTRCKDPVTRT